MPSDISIEAELQNNLNALAEKLPRFPDGRIDYTHAEIAPAISAVVEWNGKILLLKRSENVLAYQGKWNCVGGFLDRVGQTIEQKVLEELSEECGIAKRDLQKIRILGHEIVDDQIIGRKWDLYLVHVTTKNQPTIQLDSEHTEYCWVDPTELENYDTIYHLAENVRRACR